MTKGWTGSGESHRWSGWPQSAGLWPKAASSSSLWNYWTSVGHCLEHSVTNSNFLEAFSISKFTGQHILRSWKETGARYWNAKKLDLYCPHLHCSPIHSFHQRFTVGATLLGLLGYLIGQSIQNPRLEEPEENTISITNPGEFIDAY